MKVRRTLAGLAAVLFAAGLLTFSAMRDRECSFTRKIPVNSTTAIRVTKTNTIASEAAGASTSDPNTFTMGAGATGTANLYAGLAVKFTGAGSCANASGEVRLIKSNTAGKVATLDSPTTVAVDPNCTYIVGPQLPEAIRNICIGGAAGTISVSMRSLDAAGGTAGTDEIDLVGGQWSCEENPRWNAFEVLSTSATDTVQVKW